MKRIFRWILIVALVIISIPIGLYFLVFWLPKAIYPKGIHYFSDNTIMICAELAGDFHLGYARQLTDKSSLLFDLAF